MSGQTQEMNTYAVVAHEIGHSLGLHHQVFNNNSIMFPIYKPKNSVELDSEDIARIQELYTTHDITKSTIKRPSPVEDVCRESGILPASDNCRRYFRCVRGSNGAYVKYETICPLGWAFNRRYNVCDWVKNVPQCNN